MNEAPSGNGGAELKLPLPIEKAIEEDCKRARDQRKVDAATLFLIHSLLSELSNQKTRFNDHLKAIRKAFGEYAQEAEVGEQFWDAGAKASALEALGKLLNVPTYPDGSYNFWSLTSWTK